MNRMYASTMGRMTSPDKGRMVLNDPSTLNRYTYGSSDPINHTDPTGNYWITQSHPYLSDNGGFNGGPCGPGACGQETVPLLLTALAFGSLASTGFLKPRRKQALVSRPVVVAVQRPHRKTPVSWTLLESEPSRC